MGMPDWWSTRRLGLFVHATAATVPAWAPIGQYAEWYRAHLGDELDDVILHPHPMVEVLAHHRERWDHIEHYDDFVPLLEFDRFDAEDWATLARDAGAGYTIFVSKHHDGWSWWDSPNSAHRLTDTGPTRNVLAEYAAACERNDITFGTYYSLLDWADVRYPSDDYVTDVLHRDVIDLVERYGTSVLWGDGHWGHDAGHWRTAQLLDAVRAIDPEIVVNDRWWASSADVPEGAPDIVRTYEYDAPDEITDGPWELCRGIAASFGHNRNERAEHHLTGLEIVDLYTEVLAKGGNLLLNVGPASDGTIPEMQAAPLREAGTWIRRFDDVLARSRPWVTWGDASSRLLQGDDGFVYAVDLTGAGRFPTLGADDHRVVSVERVGDDSGTLAFEHDDDGLRLAGVGRRTADRFRGDDIGATVYRLTVEPADRPVELFAPTDAAPIPLAPLLDDARPGDIVQLGDGVYLGPATVPSGVILRGLGAGRTTVHVERETGRMGQAPLSGIVPLAPALTISRSGRIEHLSVTGPGTRSDRVPPVLVSIQDGFATVLGCTVQGHIEVTGDDVLLRAVTGRGVVAVDADRLSVSRCSFTGNRWDVGVRLVGGGGQTIESTDLAEHLCAVRATGTTGTVVRRNTICGRWWGVHLDQTEDAHVHANHIRATMRAVDIDGGTNAVIDGNAVVGGDSGCIVQGGASSAEIGGNHWERCRIGLLAWDATDLDHHDNICVDLHEPEHAALLGP